MAGGWSFPSACAGLTRSVVFEREGGHLVSRDHQLCGFVPMQGVGANRERLVLLHGDVVGLRVDGRQRWTPTVCVRPCFSHEWNGGRRSRSAGSSRSMTWTCGWPPL